MARYFCAYYNKLNRYHGNIIMKIVAYTIRKVYMKIYVLVTSIIIRIFL